MFKICSSIESWLDADQRNIAIVHCLTGKGRTAVVLACALTWIGEFNSPMEALTYIAERKSSSIDILTIPSQRRYIQYFSNVLDGVRPRGEPLLLRRIIMNGIPKYGENNQVSGPSSSAGCCPYIQLFKNGKILANGLIASPSSTSSGGGGGGGDTQTTEIRWLNCSEGSVSFQIDCIVQGDLLLRCRHHDPSTGARVSMFRAAFHTGYVPSGVLRLTKAQLDGPNHDDRYGHDFFIDLIFAPVEKADNTTHHSSNSNGNSGGSSDGTHLMVNDLGTKITDHTLTDKFEQMFHRDTRFWETITARKLKTKRRTSRKFQSEISEKFSILDDGAGEGGRAGRIQGQKNSDFELEDGIEVHFTSQGGGGRGGGGGDEMFISGGVSMSELSDDELIKQLTEAADNVDLDYTSSSEKSVTNESSLKKSSSSPTVMKEDQDPVVPLQDHPAAAASLEDDLLAMFPKVIEAKPVILHTPPPPAVAASISSARAELQALEDLEKELGLDLSSPSPTLSNKTKGTTPAANDNLDDLEDFLESLNK
jgi:hypothetical protein